ncbi:hypothetical protein [Candidatus Nitrososphaera evergladensis]|nr:hypothetical protein [Candidatus Nitrososphaera evergladensis]
MPYEIRSIDDEEEEKNAFPKYCSECSRPATSEAMFDLWGSTAIQFFCKHCLPKSK